MFRVGETVGIYPHSDTDTIPIGQGVLTADGAHYVVEHIRWQTPDMMRQRLRFDPFSRTEMSQGATMLRPECQARDANLLAKLFPPAREETPHG
jgi:hypothetical protein